MSDPAERDALRVVGLSKTFPGQLALDGVDLDVVPAEVHAILGHNGSGKSTLIKILAGYHVPDPGGTVHVGTDVLPFGAPQDSLRLGLRFVHQTLGLVGRFSAVENIGLGGYAHRRSRSIDWAAQTAKADRLVGRLGIDMDLARPVDECQAVERTAVAIARALDDHGGTIRFLILDEPTAALPPTEVARLFAVIREVVALGIGVVYVSHRLDEVEELADRATVLRDGRSLGTFTSDELDRARMVELIAGSDATPVPHLRVVGEDRATSPGPSAPALEVRGLAGGALRDVSLAVAPGEVVGVAGLVGSGRDELGLALGGHLPGATAASLRVGGQRLEGPLRADVLRRAGVVLAVGNRGRGAAVADFTAREVVTLPTLARHRRSGLVRRRPETVEVMRWMEELDIRPAEPERRFSLFSGGNQQKIVIAAALNQDPSVVLVDEPTAGVDAAARDAITALIRARAATGVAFVVTSSDLEDFVGLADRVVVLVDGVVGDELAGEGLDKASILASIVTPGRPAVPLLPDEVTA